jgi:CRP/FNR family transcriptional regulator
MGTAVASESGWSDQAGSCEILEPGIYVVRNEVLFRPGDARHLYLIEAGIIIQYQRRPGESAKIIEFAFAGDVIGLGSLERQTSWAEAVGEARVRCLPFDELDGLLRHNGRGLDRYAVALEREFELRREELIGTDWALIQRVAALFLALFRLNSYEGRDPTLIVDSLECGAVAAWLRTDVNSLARALVQLDSAGLIRRDAPHGLRLASLTGLQQLADESDLVR